VALGEPFQPGGQTAWVAPGRDDAGRDVVLKVGWRHFEAVHEADALVEWDGEGAVRLFAVEELAEPWLVIDAKPYVGDPTYDVLQHMLNCEERLLADPEGLVHALADLLDLERQRLLLWLFARCVQQSPDCPQLAAVARHIART
jgi:streptomycin 6-kinase